MTTMLELRVLENKTTSVVLTSGYFIQTRRYVDLEYFAI